MTFVSQAVFLDIIVREITEIEAPVLVAGHWRAEVEILDVDGYEFCVGYGDHAVEEELQGKLVNSGCSTVTWVVHSVAPNSEACAVRIVFFGSVVYD